MGVWREASYESGGGMRLIGGGWLRLRLCIFSVNIHVLLLQLICSLVIKIRS
jgi:hypothetical protein